MGGAVRSRIREISRRVRKGSPLVEIRFETTNARRRNNAGTQGPWKQSYSPGRQQNSPNGRGNSLHGRRDNSSSKTVPSIAQEDSSVAKVGYLETTAVAVTGLFPEFGDEAVGTREGDQGENVMSSRASDLSHEKWIQLLDGILTENCREQLEGYVDSRTSVEKQQTLIPNWHIPTV